MRHKLLTCLIAGTVLTGCATAQDAIYSAMEGPRQSTVAKRYTFDTPDPGITLNASNATNMSYSVRGMMKGLSDKEREKMARAIFGVAAYEACLKTGFYSQDQKDQKNIMSFGTKKARKSETCGKTNQDLMDATGNAATSYMKYGRPDSFQLRSSQLTYGGAPVGGVKTSGRSDIASWERFMVWGGQELDGMTRTEIIDVWKEFGV